MRILGIDPGQRGGAAFLDNGALTWWACWRPARHGFRATYPSAAPFTVASLADVGAVLALCMPHRIALESLHLRPGIRSASVIGLAEGAGMLLGGLLVSLDPPPLVVRVSPAEWSRVIGGTGPDQTERAVRYVRRVYPDALPDAATTGSMESTGAIAEAVLMARFAQEAA